MAPTRNVSTLIILLLSIIAIHGFLSMTAKDSLSSLAEKEEKQKDVLGVTSRSEPVRIFYHSFYLPH